MFIAISYNIGYDKITSCNSFPVGNLFDFDKKKIESDWTENNAVQFLFGIYMIIGGNLKIYFSSAFPLYIASSEKMKKRASKLDFRVTSYDHVYTKEELNCVVFGSVRFKMAARRPFLVKIKQIAS